MDFNRHYRRMMIRYQSPLMTVLTLVILAFALFQLWQCIAP